MFARCCCAMLREAVDAAGNNAEGLSGVHCNTQDLAAMLASFHFQADTSILLYHAREELLDICATESSGFGLLNAPHGGEGATHDALSCRLRPPWPTKPQKFSHVVAGLRRVFTKSRNLETGPGG